MNRPRNAPSPPASDAAFIRRAYLDAAGILPTAEEVDNFVTDKSQEKRKQLIWKFEDIAIADKAYVFPVVWWQRIIPHATTLQGYKVLPSHYVNQDLAGVWLSE